MNDEDFVMGYAVGYNDGVGSGGGGSGMSLDDYPVFPKRFRFGDSDFYFMVGDINTGFYDSLDITYYNSTSGVYDLKNTSWYRCLCIFLCKGNERFAVFSLSGSLPVKYSSLMSDGTIYNTTYYADNISCEKIVPSSSTGQWVYRLLCECHYDTVYSNGSPSYTGTSTFTNNLYESLYFNADGTVKSAPHRWVHFTGTMRVLNEGYYAELMNLMLTLPDIVEV